MFATADEGRHCTKGDVVLVQDRTTGLVSNQAFDPSLVEYDANYQNEQAVSGVFQRHLASVVDVISKHFRNHSLIEVGCGKGHFLEQLQRAGFNVTGFDPTYEGANPSVIKKYFTRDVDLRGDGLVLRHVLEHVKDPLSFLASICDANGDGRGTIYIEVPCFEWICDHRAWFDIFYEHVNYFRLRDLQRMFGTVYEAGHTFSGQYLYVVADLSTLRRPTFDAADTVVFPPDLLQSVDHYALRLQGRGATRVAVWGAASKGVVFALFMERAGARVDMIVDINPAKCGKYLPATGLLVESPSRAMETLPDESDVFVMNGNYLQEIAELTNHRFNYIALDH